MKFILKKKEGTVKNNISVNNIYLAKYFLNFSLLLVFQNILSICADSKTTNFCLKSTFSFKIGNKILLIIVIINANGYAFI